MQKAGSLLGSAASSSWTRPPTWCGSPRTCCTSTSRIVRQVHALPRGTDWLYRLLHRMTQGRRPRRTSRSSERGESDVGRSLCAFGDAAATPVLTTLKSFRPEFEAYVKGNPPARRHIARAPHPPTRRRVDGDPLGHVCSFIRLPDVAAETLTLRHYRHHRFRAACSSWAVMVYAERKVAAFMHSATARIWSDPKSWSSRSPTSSSCSSRKNSAEGRRRVPVCRADHLVAAAYLPLAPIPFGAPTRFSGLLDETMELQVSDVNVAVLVIFAVASMGVYGIVLAGWASNSEYSLLGGLRSSAQMISYELAYGMALATVVMLRTHCRCARSSTHSRATGFGFIPLVHLPAVRSASSSSRARACGNQSRAVRFPGSRAGAGRRPSHRIQLDALRHVLHGGIRQHGHGVGRRVRPVLGGWHGPFIPAESRVDLVRGQAGVPSVRLFVASLDATAVPLRTGSILIGWKVLFPLATLDLILTDGVLLL